MCMPNMPHNGQISVLLHQRKRHWFFSPQPLGHWLEGTFIYKEMNTPIFFCRPWKKKMKQTEVNQTWFSGQSIPCWESPWGASVVHESDKISNSYDFFATEEPNISALIYHTSTHWRENVYMSRVFHLILWFVPFYSVLCSLLTHFTHMWKLLVTEYKVKNKASIPVFCFIFLCNQFSWAFIFATASQTTACFVCNI